MKYLEISLTKDDQDLYTEAYKSLQIKTDMVGRPSAPAPSIQHRASNLDWQLVSYMIFYIVTYFTYLLPTRGSKSH